MGVKRRIKVSKSNDCITIATAFEEFMQAKDAENLSAATLKNYQQSYEMFVAFHSFSTDATVEEITLSHFHQWISHMKANDIKPSSINHFLRDMRAFCYWMMDDDRRYINHFKISEIKKQEEQPKFFSDEEVAALLEKPKQRDGFLDWRS